MSDEKRRFFSGKPFGFIATKIRNKILAILFGLGFGTLLVAAVALVSMQIAQQTLDEVVDKKGKVVALANEAQQELLLAREQDQKYLLNYKRLGLQNARDEYLGRVENHVQKVGSILNEVRKTDPDNKVVLDQLAEANKNLKIYANSFGEVVELSEKKGHKNLGLVGSARDTVHEVEYQVGNMGAPEIMVTVLTIRRHEKDYLLRNERSYITELNNAVETLKRQVNESTLSKGIKTNITYLADTYLEKIDAIVAVERQIADNGRVYRSAVNAIVPTMTTIVEAETAGQVAAISRMNKQNRIAFITVIIATVVTILVGIFAAFAFSRHITRQTDNIMEMFGDIGIGDFSARAEVVTSDELGEMAESLNAMLDNTLTLIQSREERDAIQESIMKLLTEISDLADGDLTVRAEVTEEVTGAIADSFNSMAEQLSRVVKDVKEASAEVGSSSNDVDQVTKKLSAASEEQAEKIQEAIASIEQMAKSIRQVSENAGQSADVSGMALNSAREGSDSVKKTNEAMAAIKENMRGTARTIKRLGESSQEIGNIVQLINDIADRTSILALNASIQAASAGEAGRGFAVVAEEVQRLAERSAESTKQIETLISGIQGEISEAGTSMEKSIQYVVDGTDLADQAYGKLEEIESVSNQLAEIIKGISERARQQSADSEMITATMQQVGVLTGQTTRATRETAASMEKITTTSRQLEQSISLFKVEVDEDDDVSAA